MSEEETLYKPTIKELIEYLSKFDKDMPIRMNDADTDWKIDNFHFEISNGTLEMYGVYWEMGGDK